MRKTSLSGLVLLLAVVGHAEPIKIEMSARIAGKTPAIIGYNIGDLLPGSNTATWLQYSHANGIRFWWRCFPLRRDSESEYTGDLSSLEDVNHRRSAFRADPLGSAFVDWSYFESAVANAYGGGQPGETGQCFALSETRRLGLEPLVMIDQVFAKIALVRENGTPDWSGQWQLWSNLYAQAFYLARYYDVEHYEYINEPDHVSKQKLSQADYLARLQIASDAIQCAVADVNRVFKKRLSGRLAAPVVTGIGVFHKRPGRPDTRDANVGWGELIVKGRNQPYALRSDPSELLFQDYALHAYGRDPSAITSHLPGLESDIAAANGGQAMPIFVTEYNVSTARNFAATKETLDSPGYYPGLGRISSAYINSGTTALYVFKFTQTANFEANSVKKNGTHIIDTRGRHQNILAATRGAEVARLIMRGFSGAKDRFELPKTPSDKDLTYAACHDPKTGEYDVLISNADTTSGRDLLVDPSAWSLPPKTAVQIEEVSAELLGGVRSISVPSDSNASVEIHPPAASVTLVRFFRHGSQNFQAVLLRTDPAQQASAVKTLSSDQDSLVLEAPTPAFEPSSRAYLEIAVDRAHSKDHAVVHVYAQPANSVATAPVLHDGPSGPDANWRPLELLGNFQAGDTAAVRRIDVTDYLHRERGSELRFILTSDPSVAPAGKPETAIGLSAGLQSPKLVVLP